MRARVVLGVAVAWLVAAAPGAGSTFAIVLPLPPGRPPLERRGERPAFVRVARWHDDDPS